MTRQRPSMLWPIPYEPTGAGQNNRAEVFVRIGAGPYTYYPGGGGAEAATGYCVAATTLTSTLAWPLGYAAWRTIYRFGEALVAAINASVQVDVPAFVASFSLSAAGVLTLSATGPAGCVFRLRYGAPGPGAPAGHISNDGAAQVLGFDTTAVAYADRIVGDRGHAYGLYLAASDATTEEDDGGLWVDVQRTFTQTLAGYTLSSGVGGREVRTMAWSFLDSDQRQRLLEWHRYAAQGGRFSLVPQGHLWADWGLSHLLHEDGVSLERINPGMPYWRARFPLVSAV